MAVESVDRIGEGLDGIVVAKVLDAPAPPRRRQDPAGRRRPGDGEALQICCGAFNMAVGDLVPLATLGTMMPGGMEIERRKLRGEWSNGMLCSARELGCGDDHGGILVLPRRRTTARVGTADRRRRSGIDARRALRPRDQPQPARRHVGRRRGPRPGRPAGSAVRHRRAAARDPCRATPRRRVGRDRRPRPVRPLPRPGPRRRRGRAVARRWLADRLTAPRHAAHQQRGRRLQLRDARAGPAQPHLRPGQGARRRPARAVGPRRRDHPHPRRRRAHPHRRSRRRDRRRRRRRQSASPASWAARPPRSPTTTTSVLLEMAWWDPMAIAVSSKHAGPALARPRPASSGAPTPRSSSWPPAASPSCWRRRGPDWSQGHVDRRRATCPTAPPSSCAPTGSTACWAPTSAPMTITDAARARSGSASSPVGRRGTFTVHGAVLPPRHDHRDRRHRGGRPAPRLQPHPRTGAHVGADRCAHPAPARPAHRSARCWSASGSTRPCRCRSSPPATWPGRAWPATPSPSPTRWTPRSRCCARRCARGC